MWLILSVISLDSLYAMAFHQFTTGRIGWSGLCIFISPLMERAEGFTLMYFHPRSFEIRVVLSFIVFLIWVCNILVGSVVAVWKLLSTKLYILVSYWCVGSITIELPLSAHVIISLLSFSLSWIDLIRWASGCVLWVGLCHCRVCMQSAINFL